jgi:hypothetical protein
MRGNQPRRVRCRPGVRRIRRLLRLADALSEFRALTTTRNPHVPFQLALQGERRPRERRHQGVRDMERPVLPRCSRRARHVFAPPLDVHSQQPLAARDG